MLALRAQRHDRVRSARRIGGPQYRPGRALAPGDDAPGTAPDAAPDAAGPKDLLGHNGGPPLEEERPPLGTYSYWKAAHDAVWKKIPRETALRRLERAEALGLTYREYTLEILDRGRYLQEEDVERIAEIKRMRNQK